MGNPIFLIACFIAGWLLRQVKGIPDDLHSKINKFIIWLPLPCITLVNIPGIDIGLEALIPVGSAWLIFLLAMVFFSLMPGIDKKSRACLVLVCGLGNTSFVGYPVLKAMYGDEAIKYAILVDQPGTFLALSTIGVIFVLSASSGKFSFLPIAKRLFSFPPFLAFLAALLLPSNWFTGEWINVIRFIGSLMVPLAMISIGLQFSGTTRNVEWKYFATGVFYKLVLAPLIIMLVVFIAMGKRGLMYDVTVLECAMPPMITASVLASEYRLNPPLANALATWGIPASAITLFAWSQVLKLF